MGSFNLDNEYKKILASSVRWIIQHRIDHYKMIVSYILRAPDPYKHQTKAKGTGGTPTPTFLPKMFTHSIDRLQNLVENVIAWLDRWQQVLERDFLSFCTDNSDTIGR